MEANRCIIKKSGVTHVRTKEFKYTWTIENYEHCLNHRCVVSPRFTTGEKVQFEWTLDLYPNGFTSDEGYVAIKPYIYTNQYSLYHLYIVLSIVDRNGEEKVMERKLFGREPFRDSGLAFKEFVRKDILLDEANGLLPNGELTIVCRMHVEQSFDNAAVEVKSDRKPVVEEVPMARRLLEFDRLERLWKSEKHSDVELVVGDDKFRVHGCILAARSPIFAAVLGEGGRERMEIDCIDRDAMTEVLRFVYCGKVTGIQSRKCDLLAAAVKYELGGLKEVCEEALIGDLSAGSVAEMLVIVDNYGNVDKLRVATIDFLAEHAKDLIEDGKFGDSLKSLSSILLADVVNALMLKL